MDGKYNISRKLNKLITIIFCSKTQYDQLKPHELYFMLDSMIRYDEVNSTFEKWYLEDARNFEKFVKTSDLLRLFRYVSKQIKVIRD